MLMSPSCRYNLYRPVPANPQQPTFTGTWRETRMVCWQAPILKAFEIKRQILMCTRNMVVETMFKVCNIVGKTAAAAGIQVEGFDSRITTVFAALKGIVGNRIHEVLLG
jgi:hypothetical protein